MYRKDTDGWLKHWDFILLDMICLQLAFVLAYGLSGYGFNPYQTMIYRNMSIYIEVADIAVLFMLGTLRNVLKRGYYREFLITAYQSIVMGAVSVLYLFLIQQGQMYSRLVMILTFLLYTLLAYITRILWKKFLQSRRKEVGNHSLLIVTTEKMAARVIRNVQEQNYSRYVISGVVLLDRDLTGQKVAGIQVVASEENVAEYVCREWIDEVLVVTPEEIPYPDKLLEQFAETGVTVHLNLAKINSESGKRQFVEKIGNYTVLTTSINYASSRQLFLKRLMDIAGGLVGCIFTAILFIFVAPAIYIASPGPIFFSQERVGKNGKKFKIYKFRSMCMDAEARKAELMSQNKMNGLMFKMDYDPRIIGSEKKDKNGNPKGIGNFIRKTSLDEFPQFWNVLKGDMSLVGTRPPTVDEWEKYELHHRSRMSIKPGITGMWQVSGRSDITDFEKIVKLDTEYIENWSIGLDIKILLKTVISVLKSEGSI